MSLSVDALQICSTYPSAVDVTIRLLLDKKARLPKNILSLSSGPLAWQEDAVPQRASASRASVVPPAQAATYILPAGCKRLN